MRGDEGLVSKAQNTDLPASECPPKAANKTPKTSCWHGVSQISATPAVQVAQGHFRQAVQTTCRHILFKFPVPSPGIELGKPGAKQRKVLARKFAHGGFNIFNAAHATKIRLFIRTGKGKPSTATCNQDASSRSIAAN
jgi:hypothetical protein